MEAARSSSAAVVVEPSGPLAELAGRDGGVAVEADDVEGFTGWAVDQEFIGQPIVDLQQCLVTFRS